MTHAHAFPISFGNSVADLPPRLVQGPVVDVRVAVELAREVLERREPHDVAVLGEVSLGSHDPDLDGIDEFAADAVARQPKTLDVRPLCHDGAPALCASTA